MKTNARRAFIWIGTLLVVSGLVLPWLMVIKVVQPTYALCLLAYAGPIVGLFMGLVAVAYRPVSS
jgi:hypothetical protein